MPWPRRRAKMVTYAMSNSFAFGGLNAVLISGGVATNVIPDACVVTVNYRYREEELVYLLDNSDATVVVYEAGFAGNVAKAIVIHAQQEKETKKFSKKPFFGDGIRGGVLSSHGSSLH